jgi:mannan endo-1,4-beta-mannosidase
MVSLLILVPPPPSSCWKLNSAHSAVPLDWGYRIAETSAYIKSLAPNHLVTVGFEGKTGEWWFKRVHSPKSIDYTCG